MYFLKFLFLISLYVICLKCWFLLLLLVSIFVSSSAVMKKKDQKDEADIHAMIDELLWDARIKAMCKSTWVYKGSSKRVEVIQYMISSFVLSEKTSRF